MPLLEARSIAVRRGAAHVLHDVSFSVDEGEIVTLLGSNGVGKSTTLRTISGLHRPFRGSIMFDGARLDDRSPDEIVRLGVSHVPEGRLVFPSLTVRENLEMGAFSRGGLAADHLEELLDRFPDLRRFLKAQAGSLSGGQQQMLAIARGIASRPRLLLLDEPSLGLAPLIVHRIGETLRELRDLGMTVLLVEQNAGLALGIASRGYVLVDGAVTLSGPAAELRNDPAVRRAYLGV